MAKIYASYYKHYPNSSWRLRFVKRNKESAVFHSKIEYWSEYDEYPESEECVVEIVDALAPKIVNDISVYKKA